ncbi:MULTISPECIES: nucleoside-diphosphate kinase [Photorhabdus]|uniref:Nucleoside diphosphate kinase-like domain-containing protein n=2 Tax=Photorhabdus asymbiotica TaxID=291112 RepID=C7BN52_PHOAA|nr:nucleoside-diphosphate kinase [Photorhabdus asymbiotica]RKS56992.1 nucleoside diphosphate kinase [Photorhabdus asymbiotica]CAQ84651.1 Hypothetical protein PAU_02559 [Photorhabdus asymbiotica]
MNVITYADVLEHLTMQSEKIRAYKNDFVPEEAWRVILSLYGKDVGSFVFGHSFILLKPETIARRLSCQVISYLAQRSFAPVAIACVELSRNAAHHIWRFQWNAATTDRIELTNLVNSQSPSILIMLRDCAPTSVPTAVKLWRLKGSAHAARRTADQLHSVLGMHNRMLGFVHTPDEPADLVRELSIFFDATELSMLLHTCRSTEQSIDDLVIQCSRAVAELESQYSAHTVNPNEVIQRLRFSAASCAQSPVWRDYSRGQPMTLAKILAHFREYGLERDSWDVLTIAAELIEHDIKGVHALLDAQAIDEVFAQWAAQNSQDYKFGKDL